MVTKRRPGAVIPIRTSAALKTAHGRRWTSAAHAARMRPVSKAIEEFMARPCSGGALQLCEAQAYGASEKIHGALRSQLPLDDETERFNGAHADVKESGDLLVGV